MGFRTWLANALINAGITIGKSTGLKKKVELSQHTISIGMADADQDTRAWDHDLYKSGNVFMQGYANPIKPRVRQNTGLENPDTVDVEEGETDTDTDQPQLEDGESQSDSPHVQLITSSRYRDYMRQDLISQLLTPESRWNLLVWAGIAIGVLQFLVLVAVLWANGTFA